MSFNYEKLIKRINKAIDKVENKEDSPNVHTVGFDDEYDNLSGLVVVLSNTTSKHPLNTQPNKI